MLGFAPLVTYPLVAPPETPGASSSVGHGTGLPLIDPTSLHRLNRPVEQKQFKTSRRLEEEQQRERQRLEREQVELKRAEESAAREEAAAREALRLEQERIALLARISEQNLADIAMLEMELRAATAALYEARRRAHDNYQQLLEQEDEEMVLFMASILH